MVCPRTLSLFNGAFELLNITQLQNGTPIPDTTTGRHPNGMIVYSTGGYVSVLIHATEPEWRPTNLTVLDRGSQFDAQWALVGQHSAAYSGPFSFNESLLLNDTHGEIMHGPLIAASLPSNIGSIQHRNFSFSEDGEYLNLVGDLGQGIIDMLWWKRLKDNSDI
ncbi:hypothetical protein SLS62_006112 [Diatrype stigma]|uniref:Lipocalin-like domain-containing protein n=1 Tax=Diatrype stigma TaxID=117547 RepID=A0AAN9YRZ2_9PEZI